MFVVLLVGIYENGGIGASVALVNGEAITLETQSILGRN